MDVPLSELYQEVILDHNRKPRNFGKPDKHNRYAHGYNPLCGDDYEVYLQLDDTGMVQDARFEGSGCAISKASSSMMTTLVKGKSAKEAETLSNAFVKLLTQDQNPRMPERELKRLRVFEGVKKFPIRVKCATLAWHALEDALKGGSRKA